VPTIKYVFLPFLWFILPGIYPYVPNVINLDNSIDATKKQHLSHILTQPYNSIGAFNAPRIAPFSWNKFNKISFIEIQNTAAQNQTKEATGSLQTIIQYQGQDSITFDIEQKNFDIYGAGTIGYEEAQLTAENISLNWATNIITATGKRNESGKIDPKPVFQEGKTKYIAEEIRYNFDSKRGTARKLFTKIDDALVRCHKAKMDIQDTYYADHIKFTTCNLTKPHYYVKARNLKFVKDEKVTSGPFQFYFDGVPTILGFFYGLFYMPATKTSGMIRPQIGENSEKGFYLKDGGYYFYFNDYIDLALKGTIYSKGHSEFKVESNYKKRYEYTGKLFYYREILSRTRDTELQEIKDKGWQFKWNHETLNNRVSSLTAEVDIQSRPAGHALDVETEERPGQISAQTKSKVRYTRKLLGTPYSLNTSIAHSKDFKKNITNITFPQVMLTTSPIYIFRWGSATPKHWYEDIYIKHTSEFQNALTNVIDKEIKDSKEDNESKETLEFSRKNWPRILKESKYGAKHTFPVETNLKLFNYFNLKPSFQYTERWYFKRFDYRYDAANGKVLSDTVKGFNRVWDYSVGADLQTTIYGTHFFNEESLVQGIRHRIEPSIGFTYTPDRLEYWEKVMTKQGEKFEDKFKDAIYGTPKRKASGLLTVKVDNVLEIKARNRDNPGAKSKKIPIFESLNMGTSYDLLADSFPLGDINLGVRTRLLDNLISVEYTSTFDPYIYKDKSRIEEFAWQHGEGLGTLKKYTFKIGTTLKSKKSDNDTLGSDSINKVKDKSVAPVVALDSTQYIDFDVPWELSLNYQQNYTCDIQKDKKDTVRQLAFNGNISITKSWKISFSSTYDFGKKELVGSATKLGIHRDLHCWEMKFEWLPLATKQSVDFSIGLKASMLKDLKFPHAREYDKV
jgi:hypothetical protein